MTGAGSAEHGASEARTGTTIREVHAGRFHKDEGPDARYETHPTFRNNPDIS